MSTTKFVVNHELYKYMWKEMGCNNMETLVNDLNVFSILKHTHDPDYHLPPIKLVKIDNEKQLKNLEIKELKDRLKVHNIVLDLSACNFDKKSKKKGKNFIHKNSQIRKSYTFGINKYEISCIVGERKDQHEAKHKKNKRNKKKPSLPQFKTILYIGEDKICHPFTDKNKTVVYSFAIQPTLKDFVTNYNPIYVTYTPPSTEDYAQMWRYLELFKEIEFIDKPYYKLIVMMRLLYAAENGKFTNGFMKAIKKYKDNKKGGANSVTATSESDDHSVDDDEERATIEKIQELEQNAIGFENYGATCFANATLQALLRLKPLRNILDKTETKGETEQTWTVKNTLKKIYDEQNKINRETDILSASLTNLTYDNADVIFQSSEYNKTHQQDATEYFNKLLPWMYRTSYDGNNDDNDTPFRYEDKTITEWYSDGKKVCTQNNPQPNTEPGNLLILDIDGNNSELKSLIDAYQQANNVTLDNYTCDTNDATLIQRHTIHKWPSSILAIQLKRFNNDSEKIRSKVKIPLNLIVHDRSDDNTEMDQNIKFNLKSVIVHQGRKIQNGHYFTYGFVDAETKPNDQINDGWYKFNDQIVTAIDNFEVTLNGEKNADITPYMLFYVRESYDDKTVQAFTSDRTYGTEQKKMQEKKQLMEELKGKQDWAKTPWNITENVKPEIIKTNILPILQEKWKNANNFKTLAMSGQTILLRGFIAEGDGKNLKNRRDLLLCKQYEQTQGAIDSKAIISIAQDENITLSYLKEGYIEYRETNEKNEVVDRVYSYVEVKPQKDKTRWIFQLKNIKLITKDAIDETITAYKTLQNQNVYQNDLHFKNLICNKRTKKIYIVNYTNAKIYNGKSNQFKAENLTSELNKLLTSINEHNNTWIQLPELQINKRIITHIKTKIDDIKRSIEEASTAKKKKKHRHQQQKPRKNQDVK